MDGDWLAQFEGQGLQGVPMGARLRAARVAVGLSLADVALAVEMTATELAAGEDGTGPIMVRQLIRLTDIYCIDLFTVATGMPREEWDLHGPRSRLQ